jgi:hypothetical protein
VAQQVGRAAFRFYGGTLDMQGWMHRLANMHVVLGLPYLQCMHGLPQAALLYFSG